MDKVDLMCEIKIQAIRKFLLFFQLWNPIFEKKSGGN